MANLFAQLVLYSYPLVVVAFFIRLPRAQALIWSVVFGYLFLPEGIGVDLPLFPQFNKSLLPSLTAALCLLLIPDGPPGRSSAITARLRGNVAAPTPSADGTWIRRPSLAIRLCLGCLLLLPFGTYLTNTHPVTAGPRYIPSMQVYDILSDVLNTGVTLLPFLLARRYLATPDSHRILLRTIVIVALIYSVLVVFEARFSPQLNRWIFGFFPHQFLQHMREGGFRPVVFLEHGLRVGIFLAISVVASIALYRYRSAIRGPAEGLPKRRSLESEPSFAAPLRFAIAGLWLFVCLVISKNLGALVLSTLFAPIALFATTRVQIVLAGCIATVLLVYPMLRGADLLPLDRISTVAETINPDRAGSFRFRLENEERLQARASYKPLFGWGGWGRSRVYDSETGEDISTTDGTWIIILGRSGWIGYLAFYGLLTIPIILIAIRRNGVAPDQVTVGLALILTINVCDMIPNSSLTPLTWLVAGAVCGGAELRESRRQPTSARGTGRTNRYGAQGSSDPPFSRRGAARTATSPRNSS